MTTDEAGNSDSAPCPPIRRNAYYVGLGLASKYLPGHAGILSSILGKSDGKLNGRLSPFQPDSVAPVLSAEHTLRNLSLGIAGWRGDADDTVIKGYSDTKDRRIPRGGSGTSRIARLV